MENQSLLRILIRRWWIFLVVFAITLGTTLYVTMRESPVYKAKATYITKLSTQIGDAKSISSVLDTLNLQDDLLGTYSEVAMSQMIKSRAITRLGLTSSDERRVTVNSKAVQGAKILEISVEGNNPGLVRDFTEAVGEETIAYADSLYPAFHLDLLDAAEVPSKPISPKLDINLLLGCVLGGFLGLSELFLTAWLSGDFKALGENRDNGVEVSTLLLLNQDLKILQEQYEHIHHELVSESVVIRKTEAKVKSLVSMMSDVQESTRLNNRPQNGNGTSGEGH